MNNPMISVIILNWNASKKTIKCLSLIKKWKYDLKNLEIIIQDNFSSEDQINILSNNLKLNKYPFKIIFNKLKIHPGVTKSFNLALQDVSKNSKYILRLDNDVIFQDNTLILLQSFLENNFNSGIAVPKVYFYKSRRLNGSVFKIPKFLLKHELIDNHKDEVTDTVLGCAVLIKKELIDKVGRWYDPSFYLFIEEAEFCFLAKKNGYFSYCVAKAIAYHDHGTSTSKHKNLSMFLLYRNTVIFWKRYSRKIYFFIKIIFVFPHIIKVSLKNLSWYPIKGFFCGLVDIPIKNIWWNENIKKR